MIYRFDPFCVSSRIIGVFSFCPFWPEWTFVRVDVDLFHPLFFQPTQASVFRYHQSVSSTSTHASWPTSRITGALWWAQPDSSCCLAHNVETRARVGRSVGSEDAHPLPHPHFSFFFWEIGHASSSHEMDWPIRRHRHHAIVLLPHRALSVYLCLIPAHSVSELGCHPLSVASASSKVSNP